MNTGRTQLSVLIRFTSAFTCSGVGTIASDGRQHTAVSTLNKRWTPRIAYSAKYDTTLSVPHIFPESAHASGFLRIILLCSTVILLTRLTPIPMTDVSPLTRSGL